MDIHDSLKLGERYSKLDLSILLNQPSLSKVREGLFHCKGSTATLFFVDLEKQGKEDRFHFDDFFEEDFFHWDSQTTQHIQSPRIQEIVKGERTPHLFARLHPKVKNVTQPFIYCGRLVYKEHEVGTSKPVHIIFQNIDYDDFTSNEDLLDIYLWKPSKIGKSTKSSIVKIGIVSERRKSIYKKPNETERKGLVTSRVGQGYYRQQILEKWNKTCPVTGCSLSEILISSHIVSWAESNDQERLDVDNGILLSPNVDSLFDKHLISFEDDGKMLVSDKISDTTLQSLGIKPSSIVLFNEATKKYLSKHRMKFKELNDTPRVY
jgi:hypothetical protein